jgi:hypothetical protein
VLALMMNAGVWASVLALPRLVEAAYTWKNYMPSGEWSWYVAPHPCERLHGL